MASANLRLVRSLYEDWARGDFTSTNWAHSEIDFVVADGPSPGEWKGLAGPAEGYRQFLVGWKEIQIMAASYHELDEERVLVYVRGSGHGRTSGLRWEDLQTQGGANLFHVSEGKVTKLVLYYDGEPILAEFGVTRETGRLSP